MLDDARRHRLVVTAEDGIRWAAPCSAVAEVPPLSDAPLRDASSLGVPDRYIPQAKPERLLAELGLDGPGIAESIKHVLNPGTTT